MKHSVYPITAAVCTRGLRNEHSTSRRLWKFGRRYKFKNFVGRFWAILLSENSMILVSAVVSQYIRMTDDCRQTTHLGSSRTLPCNCNVRLEFVYDRWALTDDSQQLLLWSQTILHAHVIVFIFTVPYLRLQHVIMTLVLETLLLTNHYSLL